MAFKLNFGDGLIDPPKFLASQLQAELQARGIRDNVSLGSGGPLHLDLLSFRMVDYRLNAFGPFVTSTYLSADLVYGPITKRIGVWVKRAKVPVWSFDEVVQPTIDEPLSIAVKELAAKIAGIVGGYKADDKAVDQIIGALSTRTPGSYLDVYALGFTNNPKAIDALVKLTDDPDDYVSMAAISGLGTLGATSKFALLKALHEDAGRPWEARVMSLKAIGDLGTAEATAYLQAQAKSIGTPPGTDQIGNTMSQVIALYLL
jgi:hypothetical protein